MGRSKSVTRKNSSNSTQSNDEEVGEREVIGNEGNVGGGNAGKLKGDRSKVLAFPEQDYQVLEVKRTSRTTNASVPLVCSAPTAQN
jgi:hypothetical protein